MIRRIWGTRVEVMPIVTVAMGVGGRGGLGVGGWVGVREFLQNQIDKDDWKQRKTKTPQKSCHKN